jgi:hypothetical protein
MGVMNRNSAHFWWLAVVVIGIHASFSFISPKVETDTHVRHDFHTSITRMDYNAREKSFEVSLRVFTDDLESALSKENAGQKFVVVNNDKNDAFVERYVRKRFALLNAQKQKKAFNYVGKEQEADATWIYIEIPCRETPSGFAVQNEVMLDLFDDQTNLLNLNYLSQRKSFIFKGEQKTHDLGI